MLKLLVEFISFFFRRNPKKILYTSFPDFSDNSFAIFCYIINNHKKNENIWLVNNLKQKNTFLNLVNNYTKSTNFKIIKKSSFLGFYYFMTSKYIFHTHGVYNKFPILKNQVNINLWHGMPLKNIGYLDNNAVVPISNYSIATSNVFKNIIQQAFKLNENNVLISGLPRNDFFKENTFSLLDIVPQKKAKNFKSIILWMPTYRKSTIGDIRLDGEVDGLNSFLDEDFLSFLNNFLSKINTLCVIKLHPMDVIKPNNFKEYSNLSIIDNTAFLEKGISLYSVLNSVDLLLTDFSSIYIDFLLLNKPIGFVIADYKEYFNSRGFVFENPKSFMPGELIKDKEELLLFLEELLLKKVDNYKEERKRINTVFHEKRESFSENIFDTILK